jgi:hypothetical protein
MKRVVGLVMLSVWLAGCATTNTNQLWYPTKEGLDFKKDKYECVQESKTPWSGGGTGLLGVAVMAGTSSSAQSEADKLFNMCMEARGYILKDKDEMEKKISNALDVANKSKEKLKTICAKPEYAVIFVKSPCNIVESPITFEQIADNTRITPEQKTVLPKLRTESEAVSKEISEYMCKNGNPSDMLLADYMDSTRSEGDKYTLDLLNGVITWGEYNQRRKDSYARFLAKWKELSQPKH